MVNDLYGPCFCEFTTGTTDIRRMFNHVTEPYKVCFARAIVLQQQQAYFQGLGFRLVQNPMQPACPHQLVIHDVSICSDANQRF